MGHITYCLLCLATDVKMYRMNNTMISIYNDLIKSDHKLELMLLHACYECAYLLRKYGEFKVRCEKAYNILASLRPEPFEVITEENMTIIDKIQNKSGTFLISCTVTDDYQPKQQECTTKKPNKVGTVKTVPINVINNLATNKDEEVQLKIEQNLQEEAVDIKCAPECVDYDKNDNDYHENISTSYKSNFNVNVWVDTEENNIEFDKNDTESLNQLDEKCYNIIYDTVTIDINKSDTDIKEEVVDCDDKKENKNLNDTLEVNINSNLRPTKKRIANIDSNARPIKKKKENINSNARPMKKKRNRKKSSNVSNIDTSEHLTLNSKVFKEYISATKLSPDDALQEMENRKESRNYIRNSYRCNLCYRGFNSKVSYESHKKKHSLDYGSFQCGVCKLCFTTRLSLKRHRLTTHTRKYSCRICTYVCFSNTQCKAHIHSHRGKVFTCNKCGKTYRFQNSLLSHMHMKHSVECVCEFCGSTFALEKGLEKHKHLIHRLEKNEQLGPQCVECDIHFASELAWKRHLVLCSRHQVQNGCKVCGEIYQSADSLKMHVKEHAQPPHNLRAKWPKNCNFCKKPQPTRSKYRQHVISEHPNKIDNHLIKYLNDDYVCEVCGKAYSSPSVLAMHQKTHSDEMPYSCSICGKRTKYQSTMKVHSRLHSDEYTDKYQCDLCGRPFSNKGRLARHIQAHMGIRPYKCRKEYCDKTFMFQSEEKTHYRHVHCKEPYPKGDGSRSGNRKVT